MAGKNSGKKDKRSKGAGGRPNWTPYIVAVAVVVIALAVYSVYNPLPQTDEDDDRAYRPAPAPPPRSAGKGAEPQISTAALEAQVRHLRDGISAVANKGQSEVFKTLQGMASKMDSVLERGLAAATDSERRAIYEEGLASKADMLSVLASRTTQIHADNKADEEKHAPLSMDGSKHVNQLTTDSFTIFLSKNPYTMVEFYAPWCGHCKKFAPEYEVAAEQLQGRAAFAAVDGTAETQLTRLFNVGGYPTLKWFVRGRPIDYSGPRVAKEVVKWIEGRLGPAYSDVDASDDIAEALEASAGSDGKICRGAGSKGSETFIAFQAAAEHFRGQQVLFVWAESGESSIVLHRKGKTEISCTDATTCITADGVIAWLDDSIEAGDFD